MLKITCDACGQHISPDEMVLCTPCDEDLHLMCAEWHIQSNWWDNARVIPYATRMNEYMDLESIMSALNIDSHQRVTRSQRVVPMS